MARSKEGEQIVTRLPPHEIEALNAAASARGIPRAALVREIVRDFLARRA
jgi:predicted DNA binding CopG/RHH family protein